MGQDMRFWGLLTKTRAFKARSEEPTMRSGDFCIGDAVLVTRIRTARYVWTRKSPDGEYYERVFDRKDLQDPRWAQITGFKTMYSGYKTFEGEDGGWLFHPGKALTFILVRFGMMNKEEMIVPEDISEKRNASLDVMVAKIYSNRRPWTDQDRKDLSDDVKNNAKRDRQGRFVRMGGEK